MDFWFAGFWQRPQSLCEFFDFADKESAQREFSDVEL